MTVITVVAIGAIALLFYNFIWPIIQLRIVDQTCQSYGAGYSATRTASGDNCIAVDSSGAAIGSSTDTAGGSTYYCCKGN